MVNKRGGKKHKRGKKPTDTNNKKNIILADDGQVYAQVQKRLGGSFVFLKCSDGIERQGHIRGKFKKKVWFNQGDFVLCTLGTFGDNNKCSIELKYTPDQVSILTSQGKLNFNANNQDTQVITFSDQINTIESNSLSIPNIINTSNNENNENNEDEEQINVDFDLL